MPGRGLNIATMEDLKTRLDVHVGRVARELGLLQRKQDDRMAVEILTDKLREYDINDPIRYDFALFGYGEQQKHQRA